MLSSAQVETLRHVYQLKNSKEIARIMGVSPHTVDQRARQAMRKMRAKSRVDAAKILASYGIFDDVTPYQSLRYQPVALEDEAGIDSHTPQEADDVALPSEIRNQAMSSPRPTANERGSPKAKALKAAMWIVAILFAAFLSFGVIQTLLILVGRSLV